MARAHRPASSMLRLALTALLPRWTLSVDYSILQPEETCGDFLLDSVGSEAECYGDAQAGVSLTSKDTLTLPGLSFHGCVYNMAADKVMYNAGGSPLVTGESLQYICIGIATSMTSTTSLTTTLTTPTTTVTNGQYSLLEGNANCNEYLLEGVDDKTECFAVLGSQFGLSSLPQFDIEGFEFKGCVYNTASTGSLLFNADGDTTYKNANFRYLCRGIATTTTITATTIVTTTLTTTTTATSTTTLTSTTTATSTTTLTTTTETSTTTPYTTTLTSTTTVSSTTSHHTSTETSTTVTETSTSTFHTVTTTTFDAGLVVDDPITVYNTADGKTSLRDFWLPDGSLSMLLQTPELSLYGAAFRVDDEQWIDRLEVRGAAGERVLQVAIRKDLDLFAETDDSWDAPEHFESLNVTLDQVSSTPLDVIPPLDAYAYKWAGLEIAFGRIREWRIGGAHAEMVVVYGKSAKIVIVPTAAIQYEREQPHLAARYAHLDLVLQVFAHDTCQGVLPELWGIRPASNSTMAMLEKPHAA